MHEIQVLLLAAAAVFTIQTVTGSECVCEIQAFAANCGLLRLTEIPQCLSGDLLKELYADENHITQLTAQQLERYPRLRILTLESNGLKVIAPDAFRHTPQLRQLDLGNNNIRELPAVSLAVPFRLQKLDLSYNNFSSLPVDTFRWAPALRELDLTGNQLTSVPNGLVPPTVRILHLGSNRLDHLPERWPVALEQLDVSDNRLRTANPAPLRQLKYLHELRLETNPWHCTCQAIGDLALLVAQRDFVVDMEDPLQCATPLEVAGKDLLPTLENCFLNPEMSPESNIPAITSGTNIAASTASGTSESTTPTTTTQLTNTTHVASTSPSVLENTTAAAAVTALTTIIAAGFTAAVVVDNSGDSENHPRDIFKTIAIIVAVIVAVVALVIAMRRVYVIWPVSFRPSDDTERLVISECESKL